MKYTTLILNLCLIIVTAISGAQVPNGGFEGHTPNYYSYGGTSSTATISWATDEWRTGGHSVKIDKPYTDGDVYWISDDLFRYWSIFAATDITLDAGAWIKLEGVNTDPSDYLEEIHLIFNFYSGDGIDLLGEPLILPVQQTIATTDWMVVKSTEPLHFTSRPDSITMKFVFQDNATGTAWLDDIFIRPITVGEWIGDLFNPNVDVPDGWFYWWPAFSEGKPWWHESGAPVFAGQDTTVTRTGNAALKMVKDSTGYEVVVISDLADFLNDVYDLVFSAWVKTELPPGMAAVANVDPSSSIGFTVTWHDGSGGADGWGELGSDDFHFTLADDTTDWTKYTWQVTPPVGATQYSMRARYWGNFMGTTYWDDFNMSKDEANGEVINIPADQPTIQAGIDVASNGDTVLVQPATYVENINFNGKNIVVGSLFLTTGDTSYISQTIVDGNQSGSVVYFTSGEGSTAVLSGFMITNGSSNSGGGIYCDSSNPSLQNVIVSGNTAVWTGGGIYCRTNSNPSLVNVIISGNTARNGGGIMCVENSSPSLVNVKLTDNSATATGSYQGGGAIHCQDNSNPSLLNVTIERNEAYNGGGIYCFHSSSPSLVNVHIIDNKAQTGGGISCEEGSNPTIENVTVRGNTASSGGGISCVWYSSPVFNTENRCNIYLNHADSGGDLYALNCPNIIEVVIDTFTVMNPTDYHAYPENNYTFDILHSVISQVEADLFISPEGNNANSGQSPLEPLQTISFALLKIYADSLHPHTVHLGQGTYSPSTNGEHFPLNMLNYISLTGESESQVILNADSLSRVMVFNRTREITVENLTVTGGSADEGGGIYFYESSPTLMNVTVMGNTASSGGGISCNSNSNPTFKSVTIYGNNAYSGGGIKCMLHSNPTFINVTVSGNTAYEGGGIILGESSPILDSVIVRENTATWGGGISCAMSNLTIAKAIIAENSASSNGGGIYCWSGNLNLVNTLMVNNTASGGGGIYLYSSYSSSLTNVTMYGNSSLVGGGVYCDSDANVSLANSILWGDLPQEVYIESGSVIAVYSDIQGGWEGEGNIGIAPWFIDAENSNFHLSNFSPCIGAGTLTGAPSTDIESNPRPDPPGSNPDMGAYENSLGAALQEPDISVSKDTLDFGQVFVNGTDSLSLVIENKGNMELQITEVVVDLAEYTVLPTSASIEPYGVEEFLITFTPKAVGDYPGTLTFTSNDPDEETLSIALLGQGVLPPVISVTPDSLSMSLNIGDTTTHTLTIANTGGSDLEFDISIERVVGGGTGGFALEFDGVDDRVRIPGFSHSTNALTLEAWVKHETLPAAVQRYITIAPEVAVIRHDGIENPGQLHFYIKTNGTFKHLEVNDALTTGQWYHIAGTWDGTTQRLYKDGVEIASQTPGGSLDLASGLLLSSGSPESMDGIMDEVRIWNVAQTQEQIQDNMNHGLSGNETGLVGYWRFDDGFGTTAYDGSGSGNDGEIVGASWTDSDAPISPSWISIDPMSGSSPPDSTVEIMVSFISGNFLSGEYSADVVITSNDPEDSILVVPATCTMTTGYFHLDIADHNNNNTILSIFNNGVVGASAGEEGSGFQYKGVNGLYEGVLIIGQSESQISGGLYRRNFGSRSLIQFSDITLPGFEMSFETSYDDGYATNPIGIYVIQRSYSKSTSPDNDYVIIDFIFINNSGVDLNNIHVGLAMDWDVGDYSNNLGDYHSYQKLSYVYEADGATNQFYYGVAALMGDVTGHSLSLSTHVDDSVYYQHLTTFEDKLTTPSDRRALLAVGPYDIPMGDSARTAFAILGGDNLSDLIANTEAAHNVWSAVLVEKSPLNLPVSFALHQNYPNPFNPVSTIRYDLPQASNVSMIVYDILGREVARLVDGYMEPGYHLTMWDSRNSRGRELPSGIYIVRLVTPEYTKSIKMVLLK